MKTWLFNSDTVVMCSLRARSERIDFDLSRSLASCLLPLSSLNELGRYELGGMGKGAYDEKKKALILLIDDDETFSAAAAFVPEAENRTSLAPTDVVRKC